MKGNRAVAPLGWATHVWRSVCSRLPSVGALMGRTPQLLKGEGYDQDPGRCHAARVAPARASRDRVRHLGLHPVLPGDRDGGRRSRRRLATAPALLMLGRDPAARRLREAPRVAGLMIVAASCLLVSEVPARAAERAPVDTTTYRRPL